MQAQVGFCHASTSQIWYNTTASCHLRRYVGAGATLTACCCFIAAFLLIIFQGGFDPFMTLTCYNKTLQPTRVVGMGSHSHNPDLRLQTAAVIPCPHRSWDAVILHTFELHPDSRLLCISTPVLSCFSCKVQPPKACPMYLTALCRAAHCAATCFIH